MEKSQLTKCLLYVQMAVSVLIFPFFKFPFDHVDMNTCSPKVFSHAVRVTSFIAPLSLSTLPLRWHQGSILSLFAHACLPTWLPTVPPPQLRISLLILIQRQGEQKLCGLKWAGLEFSSWGNLSKWTPTASLNEAISGGVPQRLKGKWGCNGLYNSFSKYSK